jgi:hypothetical protein
METKAKNKQGGEKEGVCVSRGYMRAPWPIKGSWGPYRDQEAL